MAKRKPVAQAVESILPPSLAVDPVKREFFERTGEAVQAEGHAEHLWCDIVAPMAVDVYGDLESIEEAIDEVKDYAIVPYMPEWARVAYTEKLPDARTKEGKAEGQKEKRALRKKAQTKVSDVWNKLIGYAFGDELEARRIVERAERDGEGEGDGEGEEGDTGAVDAKTLANKSLPALRKKVGEDEAPTYDPVRAAKLIDELMAVFNATPAQ